MNIYYFGTDLHSIGHYYFKPSQTGFGYHVDDRTLDLPINPERFPIVNGGRYGHAPDGMTRFYNLGHFSICAIGGSAKDHRPGSKSIFIFDKELTREEMIEILKGMPIFNKMIELMPFPVEVFKPLKNHAQ